jgi:alpha-tubulin suppressor-like RCC1 family protein
MIVGSEFCYYIDSNNIIFSFGWNEHYNLGKNNNKPCYKVEKINKNIINIEKDDDETMYQYFKYKRINILEGGAFAYFFISDKL